MRIKNGFLTCLLVTLVSFSAYANIASLYNMKDLEILEEEKNYKEFLKHARDIRPIDRNKQWKEMLHNMAALMISDFHGKKRIDKAHFEKVEALMDWPTLRQDEVFVRKRDEFGMIYLSHCFKKQKKPDQCLLTLKQFWNNSEEGQAKEDLGIQIVKLLDVHNKNLKSPEPLWPYISQTIKGQLSQMMCRRKLIQKIIIEQMVKIIEVNEKEIDREIQLEKLASNQCWDVMTPELKQALYHSPRQAQEAFYTLLKLRAAIDPTEETQFLTRFILDGPYNGPVFNRAWNNIKKLGRSYESRETIIKKLNSIDPLPDQLFEHSALKRNQIIINHISQNMPEYLDHYARTCIAYYKGTQKFPMGNPTVYCRNLFKAIEKNPEAKSWVDPGSLAEFRSLNL